MPDQPGETQPKSDIDLSGYLSNAPAAKAGWRAVKYYRQNTIPKIVQWVMRYSGGLVKDERQASYVLVGLVALAIIVSLVLVFSGGNKPQSPKPPPGYKFQPPRPIPLQQ